VAAHVIEVRDIAKSFGRTRALDGVSFDVDPGTVVGLLGPNGAGKTTMIRVLTTLLRPDSGTARVAGLDPVTDAPQLRPLIGLAGQNAAVDEMLTGRENLELVGLWYHLPKSEYRRRAQETLERLSLADAADRLVRTYSGGMKRRLDVGASLVSTPSIMFLDEPTSGLDPRSRNQLWEVIRERVRVGTTVLLTTQYMEEVEHLANWIVVVDRGRVIANGTPDQLKKQVGGARLEVRVARPEDVDRAFCVVSAVAGTRATLDRDQRMVSVPTGNGTELLLEAGSRLQHEEIAVDDLGIRRPNLDEVFLELTGAARSPNAGEPT
jgi:ABC-2 type transport system ATP-binding protein